MDEQSFEIKPFSYDILDEEAAKISKLILAVNQKCAQSNGGDVSQELFEWAEALAEKGHTAEAEFLYLHAINVFERKHGISYPITFTSLRDFARRLLAQHPSKAPDAVPREPTVCSKVIEAAIVETNAA